MKKLLLLFVLFLGLQGFAQKTVYIFNNSATATIKIGEIQTIKAAISGTSVTLGYPRFTSYTPTLITIPPGGSYTLENVANPNKFPFVSVGNTPQINQWRKSVSATSSSLVSSAQAFTTATAQIFYYIKFTGGTAGTTLCNPAIWNNTSYNNAYTVDNYGKPNPGDSQNPKGFEDGPGTQWSFIEYDAPNGIYGAGSYAVILSLNDN